MNPDIFKRFEAFWQCQDCRKIYWQGFHYQRMLERINKNELSMYSAITRVGTPDNEDYLMMIAKHGTTAWCTRVVSALPCRIRHLDHAGDYTQKVVWRTDG